MLLDANHLDGHQFEDLVERLLLKMGFSTEGRKPSADGGIDIIALSSKPMLQGRYVIQCKRYSNPVSAPTIRDLYGVVNATNANKGILITTSRFTADAVEFSQNKPIELIDGPKLLSLLQTYELLGSDYQAGTSPILDAVGFLRNDVIGLANKIQTELEEIDSDLKLNLREFGADSEHKTYVAYKDFTQGVFAKLKDANKAIVDLLPRLNQFLHSTPVEPQTARRLAKQLRETADFLLASLREITKSRPPASFEIAHGILRDLMHTYIDDVLVFVRDLEETLTSPQGTHHLKLTTRVTRTNEFTSAFQQAWTEAMSKFNRPKPRR